jgi:hypothetical protein
MWKHGSVEAWKRGRGSVEVRRFLTRARILCLGGKCMSKSSNYIQVNMIYTAI